MLPIRVAVVLVMGVFSINVLAQDMERNADHIIGLLEPRGFKTQRLSAGGAPYIYAELNTPGATETILIYAHFDGQPVQEENWAFPPFSPTLLDGPVQAGAQVIDIAGVSDSFHPEWRLYARSAGDDKMPIVALVHTIDALAENGIELSVNHLRSQRSSKRIRTSSMPICCSFVTVRCTSPVKHKLFLVCAVQPPSTSQPTARHDLCTPATTVTGRQIQSCSSPIC